MYSAAARIFLIDTKEFCLETTAWLRLNYTLMRLNFLFSAETGIPVGRQ